MAKKKKIFQRFLLVAMGIFCMQLFEVAAQLPTSAPQSPGYKIIDILNAKRLGKNNEYQFASGSVIMRQDRTYFYADSVSLNTLTGLMEAFGRVHINDADSVHTYSDYLRYKGKERTAYLKGNVKLTDGSGTLTTDQLDYDMNTSIGVYKSGGKLVNGKTVLTSKQGTYYGDTRDITFSKNVLLVDPQYRITTDSLLYNTSTRIADFMVPTTIESGDNRKIVTTDGSYNMDTRQAYFGSRPTIVDSTTTLIADEVAYDDRNGFGEARGNAILKDTAQGMVVIANNIKTNKQESSFLATENPLAIIQQDGDSTYIAADTLYSGKLSNRIVDYHKSKINQSTEVPIIDSLNYNIQDNVDPEIRPHLNNEVLPGNKNTYIQKPAQNNNQDSVRSKSLAEILKVENAEKDAVSSRVIVKQDTVILPIDKGKTTPSAVDRNKVALSDSINSGQYRGIDFSLPSATLEPVENNGEEDKKDRFIEAYYNVKIFSDSLQAVCDSMFFSSQDSIFRLLKDPIAWTITSSQFSQITGDTIFVYTQNKKPKKIDVWKNAMMIGQQYINASHTLNNYYNQITGNYIFAYFTNGALDSMQARYNAESIYYIIDDGNKYLGVNQQKSEVLDFYFIDKKLDKIVGRMDVDGKFSPMGQVNHETIKLPRYHLYDDVRPKSKFDLIAPTITETPEIIEEQAKTQASNETENQSEENKNP